MVLRSRCPRCGGIGIRGSLWGYAHCHRQGILDIGYGVRVHGTGWLLCDGWACRILELCAYSGIARSVLIRSLHNGLGLDLGCRRARPIEWNAVMIMMSCVWRYMELV